MSRRQPPLFRPSSSGRRLHEDYKGPHARKEDGDECESRGQANSDPRPVSTG
jgi:hypothetical protein